MTETATQGAGVSTLRLTSYQAVLKAHNDLLEVVRGAPAENFIADMKIFMTAAAQSGKWIEAFAERRAVQGQIGHWMTMLTRIDSTAPNVELADFDAGSAVPLQADCPYPGLRAYGLGSTMAPEEDIVNFYGRESEIKVCCEHLLSKSLLAIVAGSGTGKSSLAMAGILPQLPKTTLPDWICAPRFTPGANPTAALADTLSRVVGVPDADSLEAFLKDWASREESGTAEAEELLRVLQGKRVVLFVDQFEELFSLCRDQERRKEFAHVLCALVEFAPADESPLRILLTMRTDHVHFAEALTPELYRLILQYALYLEPLSVTDIRQVIAQPARRVGLRFVPNSLIDDLASQTARLLAGLPLLQFALRRLWFGRATDKDGCLLDLITAQQAAALVGSTASSNPAVVEKALSFAADELYVDLDPTRQRICKRVFLELTEISDNFEDPLRRRREEANLTETIAKHMGVDESLVSSVIALLVEKELLLRTGSDGKLDRQGTAQLEVAHEALFRNWETFRSSWLPVAKGSLLKVRTVERETIEWEKNTRSEEHLKERGSELNAAEKLCDEGWLSKSAADYLSECRKRENQVTSAAEAARKTSVRNKILWWTTGVCVVALGFLLAFYFRMRAVDAVARAYGELDRQPNASMSTAAKASWLYTISMADPPFTTRRQLRAIHANAVNWVALAGDGRGAAIDKSGSYLMELAKSETDKVPAIRIFDLAGLTRRSDVGADEWRTVELSTLKDGSSQLIELRLNKDGTRAMIRRLDDATGESSSKGPRSREIVEIFAIDPGHKSAGEPLARIDGEFDRIELTDFSSDGNWVVITGTKSEKAGTAQVQRLLAVRYDVANQLLYKWKAPAQAQVTALAVSDGGQFVALGLASGLVVLPKWTTQQGLESTDFEPLPSRFDSQVTMIRTSVGPQGQGFVVAGGAMQLVGTPPFGKSECLSPASTLERPPLQGPAAPAVILWTVDTQANGFNIRRCDEFSFPNQSTIESLSLSESGARLLTVTNSVIAVRETAGGKVLLPPTGPAGLLQAELSSDGQFVLALRETGGTNPRAGQNSAVVYKYLSERIEHSENREIDGRSVPLTDLFGNGWHSPEQGQLQVAADHEGQVAAYVRKVSSVQIGVGRFEKDGRMVEQSPFDWTGEPPELVSVVRNELGPTAGRMSAAFASRNVVAVVNWQQSVDQAPNIHWPRFMQVEDFSGPKVRDQEIECIAMAPGMDLLLVASNQGQLYISEPPYKSIDPIELNVDPESAKAIRHQAGVGACAISSDGHTATGDYKGWIALSSRPRNQQQLSTFVWVGGSVKTVDFSADGRYVLAHVPSQSKLIVIERTHDCIGMQTSTRCLGVGDKWKIVKEVSTSAPLLKDAIFLRTSQSAIPTFAEVMFDASLRVHECPECIPLERTQTVSTVRN